MKAFEINAIDQLELNGKPAAIESIIDAVLSDDFHEHDPIYGGDVCGCWLCQSLIPALEQLETNKLDTGDKNR